MRSVVVAVALLFVAPVAGAAVPKCQAAAWPVIVRATQAGMMVTELGAHETAEIAAFYNAQPPVSNAPINRVIVLTGDKLAPNLLVIVARGDCVYDAVKMPLDTFHKIVGLPI